MPRGLMKVHGDIAQLKGLKESLFSKSHIKLLHKAQYLIYVSICAIISEKSDGLSVNMLAQVRSSSRERNAERVREIQTNAK